MTSAPAKLNVTEESSSYLQQLLDDEALKGPRTFSGLAETFGQVIGLALGCESVRVVTVPVGRHGPVPRELDDGLDLTFAAELGRQHGFKLLTSVGNSRYTALQARFGGNRVEPLMTRLNRDPFTRLPIATIRALAVMLEGFSSVGRQTQVDALTPIARMLPYGVPIGCDRDGRWVVLVPRRG